jgi:predicted DNA-binding transcriptional regulator AlpA
MKKKPAGTIPVIIPIEHLPAMLTREMICTHIAPIKERTFFKMLSQGRFPPADISCGGKVRLWKKTTIEAWMNAGKAVETAAIQ